MAYGNSLCACISPQQGYFRMENLPLGRNAIGKKWVFKVNAKPDGSVDRFKARMVAQGFSQRARVDYSETFSPIVKLSTLRTVIAIAAKAEHAHALGEHCNRVS
jgi:hypothetical protein